ARPWPTWATSYVVGPQQYTPTSPGRRGLSGVSFWVMLSWRRSSDIAIDVTGGPGSVTRPGPCLSTHLDAPHPRPPPDPQGADRQLRADRAEHRRVRLDEGAALGRLPAPVPADGVRARAAPAGPRAARRRLDGAHQHVH